MSSSAHVNEVLREWSEVFMRRSMTEFKRHMDDSGLSWPHVTTLMRLHHQGPCGVSGVADNLGVTNAAASQMVDRLVQQGLLERAEDPDDRRAKQLTLTRKARGLLEKGIEARRKWMEELTASLSREQQTAIVSALTLLTEAARNLEAPKAEKV